MYEEFEEIELDYSGKPNLGTVQPLPIDVGAEPVPFRPSTPKPNPDPGPGHEQPKRPGRPKRARPVRPGREVPQPAAEQAEEAIEDLIEEFQPSPIDVARQKADAVVNSIKQVDWTLLLMMSLSSFFASKLLLWLAGLFLPEYLFWVRWIIAAFFAGAMLVPVGTRDWRLFCVTFIGLLGVLLSFVI
jgi:hypothetical protein